MLRSFIFAVRDTIDGEKILLVKYTKLYLVMIYLCSPLIVLQIVNTQKTKTNHNLHYFPL